MCWTGPPPASSTRGPLELEEDLCCRVSVLSPLRLPLCDWLAIVGTALAKKPTSPSRELQTHSKRTAAFGRAVDSHSLF